MKAKDDPTITQIRETRHLISEQCGHDPRRVVDYYIELQRNYQHRLLVKSDPKTARVGLRKPSVVATPPAWAIVPARSPQTYATT